MEQKGGLQACQENDKILKELSDLEAKSTATPGGATQSAKTAQKTSALEDLKDDLMVDPDAAMEKNLTVFSRKFEYVHSICGGFECLIYRYLGCKSAKLCMSILCAEVSSA